MVGRGVGVVMAVFLAGIAACTATVAEDSGDLRARGKQLFTDHGCYGCHMIEKFGTPIAPDLSHVGSKYTQADLTRWLQDPSAQKPTAHMPKIAMPRADAQALASYLAALR
jgi:mono/diheme cytochrome c family protein